MKTTSLILCTVLLFATACKKDKTNPSSGGSTISLINKWEMDENMSSTYLNGNFAYADTAYYAPGETWIEFRPDYTMMEYHDSLPADSGTYIIAGSVLKLYQPGDSIQFNFTLSSSQLTLINQESQTFGSDTYQTTTTIKLHKL
jgi:hypothetical protein